MANSSIQRTLDWCKDHSYPTQIIEKFVKPPKHPFGWRVDTWGADVQALIGPDTVNIQCALGESHKGKVKDAIANDLVKAWLTSPQRRFWIMTWSQHAAYKVDGERSKIDKWVPRVTEIARVSETLVALVP